MLQLRVVQLGIIVWALVLIIYGFKDYRKKHSWSWAWKRTWNSAMPLLTIFWTLYYVLFLIFVVRMSNEWVIDTISKMINTDTSWAIMALPFWVVVTGMVLFYFVLHANVLRVKYNSQEQQWIQEEKNRRVQRLARYPIWVRQILNRLGS